MNWRTFGFGFLLAMWINVLRDVFGRDLMRRGFALMFAVPLGLLITVVFIVLSIVSK